MPSYPARRAELHQRLSEAPLEPIERVRLAAVVNDWAEIRDAALTMATVMVADTGKDPLAKDYTSALSDFRSRMDSKLGDMLSGLSTPSNAAVQFRERAIVEEAGFWGAPGLVFMVEARDDLVLRANTFREMADALEKKWAAFTEEDLRVERAEEEAARRINDILNRAMAEQTGILRQLGNSSSELLQAMSRMDDKVNEWAVAFAIGVGVPPNIAAYIPKLSSIAQGAFDAAKELGIPAAQFAAALAPILVKDPGFAAVEWFKALFGSNMRDVFTAYSQMKKGLQYALQAPFVEQVSQLRALMPVQSGIIVTFTGTRGDVDRFLQANNLDIAQRKLDIALADLDQWRDRAMTPAQQTDAGQVRDTARDALRARLAASADEWNKLFAKHSGRFIGALSTETETELLNTDIYQVTVNGVVQLGLDEKLREWRRTSTEIPARIGDSFAAVERAFERLPIELKDRIRGPIDSYLTDTLRSLNAEAEETRRALDECALAVNARKFEQDISRAPLRDRLRN